MLGTVVVENPWLEALLCHTVLQSVQQNSLHLR